jgi:hypothetical protein
VSSLDITISFGYKPGMVDSPTITNVIHCCVFDTGTCLKSDRSKESSPEHVRDSEFMNLTDKENLEFRVCHYCFWR